MKLLAGVLMALVLTYRQSLIGLILYGGLCTGAWCPSVGAETVELQGEQLQVETLAVVDQKTTRLTVAGSERLVANDEVGVAALEMIVGAGGELPVDTFKRLLKGALGRYYPAPRVAHSAFLGLSRALDSRAGEWRMLLEELAHAEQGRAFFRECLSSLCARSLGAEQRAALFFLAVDGGTLWVREVRPEYLQPFHEVFENYADSRWESLIAAERLDEASDLVAALAAAFPFDESLARRLKLLNRRLGEPLRGVGQRLNAGEFELACEEIDRVRIVLEGEPALAQRLSSFVVELTHRVARRARAAGNADALLSCLSRLDFDTRTQETHTLLRGALELQVGAVPDREWGHEISTFLLKFSRADPEIARLLGTVHEVRVRRALKSSAFYQAGALFEVLLQHRPDPDVRNDVLRASFASALSSQRRYAAARAVLQEVKTRLGMREKVLLLLSGYYFEPLLLVVMIGLSLALGAVRLQAHSPGSLSPDPVHSRDDERRQAVEPAHEQAPLNPGFSAVRATSHAPDEYTELLSFFSLGRDVSLEQIKHVYRVRIKKVHPDVDKTGAEKEQFLELTKRYNRLLELRRELGLD